MLSRVAESLYWIGRYLERAENVNRLLLVTTEVAVEIEGLDDSLAQAQWDELLVAVGSNPDPGLMFSPELGLALPYLKWLLLDDENPVSVRKSLGLARENARGAREAITRIQSQVSGAEAGQLSVFVAPDETGGLTMTHDAAGGLAVEESALGGADLEARVTEVVLEAEEA